MYCLIWFQKYLLKNIFFDQVSVFLIKGKILKEFANPKKQAAAVWKS